MGTLDTFSVQSASDRFNKLVIFERLVRRIRDCANQQGFIVEAMYLVRECLETN